MPGLFLLLERSRLGCNMGLPELNGCLLKFNGDNAGMNHDAMEAQMESIMSEASTNASPQQPAPTPAISKRLIALLMMAAALFGALIMGLIRPASGQRVTTPEVVETRKSAEGDPKMDLFFFGVGRYRK